MGLKGNGGEICEQYDICKSKVRNAQDINERYWNPDEPN